MSIDEKSEWSMVGRIINPESGSSCLIHLCYIQPGSKISAKSHVERDQMFLKETYEEASIVLMGDFNEEESQPWI